MPDNQPAAPAVAVVMRTKNRPLLLRRAVASVLEQTFDDFVLVVVNDVGDQAQVDRVIAECADQAAGRIQVIHRTSSMGMESASNAGILASSSEFVVVHDDDDSWDPDFLKQTVAYLQANPSDSAVATRTAVVYERVDGDTVTEVRREILASDKSAINLLDVLSRNYAPPISLLYRRAVHQRIGMYDESLPVLGDWELYLRILLKETIGFIDGDPLAFWHHRTDSTGDMGNSVVVGLGSHLRHDQAIRDRALRNYLDGESSLGLLLFIAEFANRQRHDSAARTDHLGTQIHELDNVARNINRMVADIVATLDSRIYESNAQLRELNASAISGFNRSAARFSELERRVDRLQEVVLSQTPRGRARAYARNARAMLRRVRRR